MWIFYKTIGFPGYFQHSLLTTTFLKPSNAFFFQLIQNNTPAWDWNPIFRQQTYRFPKYIYIVNEFVEKMTTINQIFKK